MCLSETDSHKQKKMTSESPRYIPTTTTSSYKSDRSTTRGIIRASTHDLLHGAQRLENPQDLYRQHRNEHLDSTTVGGPARSLSGNLVRRPETSSKARRLLEQNAAAKRAAADRGLGLTGATRARDDGDDGMGMGSIDDGGDNYYTHVPAPGAGAGAGLGARDTPGPGFGAPSSAINLPIRGGHDSHYDSGTATNTGTNRPTSSLHPAHHHRERHSLRAPKERVTTYVQDNIIMRISSNSHSHESGDPSRGGAHHGHHSYLDDPNGNGIGHLSSSGSSNEHRGSGAEHRRKWYRERMARIIQDIEPGLPPSGSPSGSGRSGSGRGAGGAGGYVYSGMGMGSGAGAGGYGGSAGGYGGAGAGAGGGYGTTNGTNGNGRDSGYGSFSGSPGSYGRGH